METDRTNWAIENVVHIVVASVLDNVLFIYSIDIEYHDCYSEHGLFNTHIVDVYKCHWNNGCACECDRGTLFFPPQPHILCVINWKKRNKKTILFNGTADEKNRTNSQMESVPC